MTSPSKLAVTRGETFALECAIRQFRDNGKWMRKIGLIQSGDDPDGKIAAIEATMLADLRKLRRRISDGRPRQTYK